MKPMINADIGVTNPEPGVMATNPATAPETPPRTVGLPWRIHSITSQPSVAAAAPKCVATKALVARPLAASALPALNPNQPTQSRHAPITLITRLWGLIGVLGYPRRLPRYKAQTSAETPLVM